MRNHKSLSLLVLGYSLGVALGSAHAGSPFEDYARDAQKTVSAVEASGDRELKKKQKAAEAALGDFTADIADLEKKKAAARAGITSSDSDVIKLQAQLDAIEDYPAYRKAARDVASLSRLGRLFKPDPQIVKDQKELAKQLEKARKDHEEYQAAEGRLSGQIAQVKAAQQKAQVSSEAAARSVDAFLRDKKLTEENGKAVATDDLKFQEARAAAGRLVQGWETEGLDTRLLFSDYQNLKQSGKLTALQLDALENQLNQALEKSYMGQYIGSRFRSPEF
jgi:peptidoglycan hydrolase CwlO-like protein